MSEYEYCPIVKDRCVAECVMANDERGCMVADAIESLIQLGAAFGEVNPTDMMEAVDNVARVGVTRYGRVMVINTEG